MRITCSRAGLSLIGKSSTYRNLHYKSAIGSESDLSRTSDFVRD
jgi:hypothetical protein